MIKKLNRRSAARFVSSISDEAETQTVNREVSCVNYLPQDQSERETQWNEESGHRTLNYDKVLSRNDDC